jgi:hypothetical protein
MSDFDNLNTTEFILFFETKCNDSFCWQIIGDLKNMLLKVISKLLVYD